MWNDPSGRKKASMAESYAPIVISAKKIRMTLCPMKSMIQRPRALNRSRMKIIAMCRSAA
jgi:hypothetical protein